MNSRGLAALLTVVGVVSLMPVAASGQAASTPLRTPWGHPDLQGIWDFRTITPLQRPEDLADREFLTAEEAANLEEERIDRNRSANAPSVVRTEPLPVGGVGRPGQGYVGSYNNYWLDQGTNAVSSRRTSLIVDPPNGRMPPLTPEAEQRVEARRTYLSEHRADSWEDLTMGDRCLFTTGLPIIPNAYNNNINLLQTPDQVVMLIEMTHTLRVVHLDGRPHGKIRQWMGESRGHWEGETLVVETKNFGLQKGLDLGAGTPSEEPPRTHGSSNVSHASMPNTFSTNLLWKIPRRIHGPGPPWSPIGDAGSDVRVRVSRGELLPAADPLWCAGGREGRRTRGEDGIEVGRRARALGWRYDTGPSPPQRGRSGGVGGRLAINRRRRAAVSAAV